MNSTRLTIYEAYMGLVNTDTQSSDHIEIN